MSMVTPEEIAARSYFLLLFYPDNRDFYKVYLVTTTPYILVQVAKTGAIRTTEPTAIQVWCGVA